MPTSPAGSSVRTSICGADGAARRWSMALLAGGSALVVLLVALRYGGGAAPEEGPVDPGPITRWVLPIAELGMDVAAVGTLGALIFGVVLVPSRNGELRGSGLRAVHRAAWWAAAWVLSTCVTMLLTLSDFLGVPPQSAAYLVQAGSFVATTAQGQALLLVAALALVVACLARWVLTLNAATVLSLVAFGAVLPPAFTGHSSSAADHDMATSSLVVHIVAATVWVGGLVALVWYGRASTEVVKVAAPRYSGIALWCFIATGVSGLVNAWVRMSGADDLWTSSYGQLVLGKIVALVALGWFGWWHRRRTLGELSVGRPGAFRRLASGEVLVMLAAMGLAVALSRTPPPVPEEAPPVWSVAESLVGHEVPPVTTERLLTLWRPDTIVIMIAVVAIVGYVTGVRRMRVHGGWPVGRTMSWISGVVVAVVLLCSGLATYGPVMFSVHMVQHMGLTMLVPILLAVGAPIKLALRAIPPKRRGGDRGAREWILTILHSPVVRTVTHPLVALTVYIGTLYGFYFSPLFDLAMESHTAHLLIYAHFVMAGSVYFWPIIGADPMPRNLPYFGRFLLLFASVPFHAFLGVIMMMAEDMVIGASWYGTVDLPWVDRVQDQYLGGGIAWAMGEVPTVIVMIVLLFSWRRSDARAARRMDRRADTGRDVELAEYNAHLARLAAQDRQAGPPKR